MRLLLVLLAVIALVAVLWQRVARRNRALVSSGQGEADTHARTAAAGGARDLRLAALRREFLAGVDTALAHSGEPRAVVMDWGLDNGAATVVAYDDATTSLYLSSGGGVIGAGAHEAVRRAAAGFRAAAAEMRDEFSVVPDGDDFTLPSNGLVTFYLVTDSATLRAGPVEARLLAAHTHPMAQVGAHAQAVITAIRETEQA